MNLKRIFAVIIAAVLLLSFTGCRIGFLPKPDWNMPNGTEKPDFGEDKSADEMFEEFMYDEFVDTITNDALSLHFKIANPEKSGIERPDSMLGKVYDIDDYDEVLEECEDIKSELSTIRYDELCDNNKIKYDYLMEYMDIEIELAKYPQFISTLNPQYSNPAQLLSILLDYEFYDEKDIKDYLKLLDEIPSNFEECIKAELKKKEDYRLADFSIDMLLKQVDNVLNDEQSLISSFEKRLAAAEYLNDNQREQYIEQNKKKVKDCVIKAYEDLKRSLEEIKSTNGLNKGLSSYKGGKEYYEALFKSKTYSSLSPKEAREALEQQFLLIQLELGNIISTDKGMQALNVLLEGKDLGDFTPDQMIKRLEEMSKNDFPQLSEIRYSVDEIPVAARNDNVAAYYILAPLDETSHNKIYYNPQFTDDTSLFMTVAHEGYPGHMYQWNYFIENGEPELLMCLDTTGYMEGWSMYIEANCMKYFDFGEKQDISKELVQIYTINMKLSYLLSALADILVNYYGYDKAELAKTFSNYGYDSDTSDSVYETVVAVPGLYPCYYIGCYELLRLKQMAEEALGSDFNEKEFNTLVLDTGICYYSQLEEVVEQFIDDRS